MYVFVFFFFLDGRSVPSVPGANLARTSQPSATCNSSSRLAANQRACRTEYSQWGVCSLYRLVSRPVKGLAGCQRVAAAPRQGQPLTQTQVPVAGAQPANAVRALTLPLSLTLEIAHFLPPHAFCNPTSKIGHCKCSGTEWAPVQSRLLRISLVHPPFPCLSASLGPPLPVNPMTSANEANGSSVISLDLSSVERT